jgi:hypothetical protein
VFRGADAANVEMLAISDVEREAAGARTRAPAAFFPAYVRDLDGNKLSAYVPC